VRYVIDLDAVCEVADPGPAWIVGSAVGVGDDYYSVTSVDEFLSVVSALTFDDPELRDSIGQLKEFGA
jgi:hypothetical protein